MRKGIKAHIQSRHCLSLDTYGRLYMRRGTPAKTPSTPARAPSSAAPYFSPAPPAPGCDRREESGGVLDRSEQGRNLDRAIENLFQVEPKGQRRRQGQEQGWPGKEQEEQAGRRKEVYSNVVEDEEEELEDDLLDCLMCHNETLVDFLRKHIKFHHMIQVGPNIHLHFINCLNTVLVIQYFPTFKGG